MNWKTVRVLFSHEMRMLVRDRRTVVLAVVLPVVIMPVFLLAAKVMGERREKKLEETTYLYAVVGSERESLRALIERGRQAAAGPAASGGGQADSLLGFQFAEKQVGDPEASLKSKELHFYIEALSGAAADALPKDKEPAAEEKGRFGPRPRNRSRLAAAPERLPGVPMARIFFLGDRDESEAGRSKMRALLLNARGQGRDALLKDKGFPLDPGKVIDIEETDIASAGQVTGSYVGRFLTVFLLMFMLTGGSVVAMDIIAGEKERGSLETLLTTAVRRGEIVAAKQLAILAVALVITFIQVANILVYLTVKVIKLPEDFVIDAPPATVFALLLLFIPVAALVAAVLLMISAYAKSYKEAQLYFFPVYLVSLVPALAAVLPGISLRSAIVLVPLANVSVAVHEIMVGKYDWPMIFLSFAVMMAAAVWAMKASADMLSQERLITAVETDAADFSGGAALFPKHVLRWYAVAGAIMFAVALNIPAMATFRIQLFFNEVVLFLGLPLLMMRKYRLNPREALALRPVKPVVWLMALIAIPSGHLVSVGVFRLASQVLPVPERVLEQFARDVLPSDIPTWQLLFFLSVLPAICEEIAFRGTLLYGLRRRFRPVVLALVVGLIFGLFHVALFRIIPTAFLGVVLTAVTLLTGSIFPSMLIHAGNNAFAFLLGETGIPVGNLDWWLYAAAAVVFGLCFHILYRTRTPYPGLKHSSKISPAISRQKGGGA